MEYPFGNIKPTKIDIQNLTTRTRAGRHNTNNIHQLLKSSFCLQSMDAFSFTNVTVKTSDGHKVM